MNLLIVVIVVINCITYFLVNYITYVLKFSTNTFTYYIVNFRLTLNIQISN